MVYKKQYCNKYIAPNKLFDCLFKKKNANTVKHELVEKISRCKIAAYYRLPKSRYRENFDNVIGFFDACIYISKTVINIDI